MSRNPRVSRIVFISFAIGCLMSCSQTSIEDYMRQAAASMEQGDIPAAVIDLKNVLQKMPEHSEARWMLAEAYMLLGYGYAAELELRRIEEERGEDPEYFVALSYAMLSDGKLQDVIDQIEQSPPAALTVGAWTAKTEAYAGLGKVEEASSALENAIAMGADDVRTFLAMAILALANSDHEQAIAFAKEAQAVDPKNPRPYIVEGRIQLPQGNFIEAETVFRQAVLLVPARADAKTGVIRALLGQKKWEEARTLANKLARQYPNGLVSIFLRSVADVGLGNKVAARDGFREVLSRNPNHVSARLYLGRLLFEAGELEQGEDLLRSVVADAPESSVAREAYASILIKNGKAIEAIKVLVADPKSDGITAERLWLMGYAFIKAGRFDEGVVYLEKAMEHMPESPDFKTDLALAKVAISDFDGALGEINELVDDGSSVQRTEILKLLIDLRQDEYEAVKENGAALLVDTPDDALLHFIVASAHLKTDDREQAAAGFRTAVELEPTMSAAMISLAHLAYLEGDRAQEREWLEQALEADPFNLRVLLPLARAIANSGDIQGAIKILEQARDARPNVVLPILTLARVYLGVKDFPNALEAANEAFALSPQNPGVLLARGYAQIGTKDVDGALVSITEALRLRPESTNSNYAMAAVLYRLGRPEEAREFLNKSLNQQDQRIESMLTMAELEAEIGSTENALQMVEQIKELFPEAPAGHLLEGDILAATGKNDAAAEQAFERAIAMGAGSQVVLRSYKLLMRQGRNEEALGRLTDWVEQHPDDFYGWYILGLAYQETGDTQNAIATYEKMLETSGTRPTVLNNLAWLYMQTGDERALQTAQKAHSLAPEDGGIADTLGWILVKQDQIGQGLRVLQQAAEQLPDSPTVKFHLGVALARSGDTARAKDELRAALDLGEFEDRDRAQKMIDGLR